MAKKKEINGWKVACIGLASALAIGGAVWGGFAINDAVKEHQAQQEEQEEDKTPTDDETQDEVEVGGNAVITNYASLCEAYM